MDPDVGVILVLEIIFGSIDSMVLVWLLSTIPMIPATMCRIVLDESASDELRSIEEKMAYFGNMTTLLPLMGLVGKRNWLFLVEGTQPRRFRDSQRLPE